MNYGGSEFKCPACGEDTILLLDWKYSGLNDSVFNYNAYFRECTYCGLVYNSSIADAKLVLFYNNECSYFEKNHFDVLAPENIQKYNCYANILLNAGLSGTSITDVGCGRGGFLLWLKKNSWNANCRGIDIDLKSIPNFNNISGEQDTYSGIAFQEGRAIDLPFPNGSQSLLTYFHVLEHIVDLNKVLKEAHRVLRETGYVLIEVPDAEKYIEFPIGTAFWFSIREHVFHFSPSAICCALNKNGFEVISVDRNVLPTPEFSYPSLIVLAKKCRVENPVKYNERHIASFAIQSKNELKAQARKVLDWSSNFSQLTFWGCSVEFFSLMPILNIHHFAICDSSKNKQKCSFMGIPIKDPATVLKYGALIVVPYLFSVDIFNEAIERGWAKEAILCLK